MKSHPSIALAATLVGLLSAPVAAQQTDDPDWPCQQRKVPELGPDARDFPGVAFRLAVGEIGVAVYNPDRSPFGFHVIKRLE